MRIKVYSGLNLFYLLLLCYTFLFPHHGFAALPLPRAHHLYISGTTAGANPATASAMEEGFTLKVWYTYADTEPESGTTFQWYTYDDELGTNKQAIAGATSQTFTLAAAQVGKHISVEVHPRNASDGFGAIVEFKPWDNTHPNKILAAGFSCNKAGGGVVGPGNLLDTTTPLCSPRSTNWDISYTGIDWSSVKAPRIFVNWGDGSNISYAPTLRNNLITQVDTFNLTNESTQVWRTVEAHTFDYAGGSAPSTTVNAKCTYTLQATWGLPGNGCNLFGVQTQPFTVWDKEDNTNLGTLDVNHDPTSAGIETGEVTDICIRDQRAIRLQDNSDFNCTDPLETIGINNEARWVQWVYGTASTITTGAGASEKIVINGVSYTSADLPVYGKVTYQPAATTMPLPSITDNIQMPTSALAGQTLVVTMRSWNTCNPLDRNVGDGNGFNPPQGAPFNVSDITGVTNQPGLLAQFGVGGGPIFANKAPVLRTYTIRIIAKPAAITTTGLSLCYNAGTPVNFTGVGIATPTRTAVNWYKDLPSYNSSTKMVNGAGLNSLTFASTSYTVANGAIGAPFTTNNANGKYYSVWATQVTGGTNSCESDPVEIVIVQQPRIDIGADIPSAPVGSASVCNGPPGTNENYTTSAPNDKTIAAATVTNAAIITLPTENLWSHGFGAGVSLAPSTGNATTVTYNFAAQPNPSVTNSVSVRRRYVTTTNIAVVSPLTVPLPTYNINPQSCQNANVNLSVTVYGQTVGGAVTINQTICDGSAFANLNLAGQRGSVLRWERKFNADPPVVIAGTAGAVSYSEIPPNGVGTYTYYAVVQNTAGGPCNVVNSTPATITVNPVPPQPIISQTAASNGLVICADGVQQTVLQSSDVGGLAASYQWYKDAAAVVGATSSTITLTTTGQSGSYAVKVIGVAPSNCASPVSNPVMVTINPLPTAPNPTGGGAVCSGNPAPDIVWNGLTGTAPFSISYTITKNPGNVVTPMGPVAEPTATFTIAGPNPAGAIGDTFDYKITALVDANGCSASAAALAALSSGHVSIGGTAPNFDTPPSLTPTSTCDNGGSTTDPQLNFSLDGPSTVVASNYTLTYNVDGGANQNKTFTVIGNGDPSAAITFSEAALNNTGPHTIKIISIQTPAGCQTTFNTLLNFTVNPLPSVPVGAVNSTACSNPGTGVALSVTDPGAGFTVMWSTTGPAVFTNAVPGSGAASGSNNRIFTPTTSATATFYAFSQNNATGCMSSTGVAVTQTQDLLPAAANAGPDQPNVCADAVNVTLAGNAATNGGTGTWTGPGGVTFANLHNQATTASGLSAPAPGGVAISTTLTWTVVSALGVCPNSTDDVVVTINPLPTSIDPAPALCEDVAGGGSHANVDLTTYNSSVTNTVAVPGTTVAWFSDVARTMAVVGNVIVTNGAKYYFRATSPAPFNCNNTGLITFTVNSLPAAVNQNLSFCEDVQGGNQHGPFDLTTNDLAIAGGSLVNRSVTWYSDAGLTTLLPTPNNYTLTGTVNVYAKVTNTVTGCTNSATINLVTKPRPVANAVQGNASVCTGNTVILYQLDPSFNPGSTYTWNVVGTPAAAVEVFGGGGTNSANFFVLLKFPAATGTVDIDVFETLNGCTGVTNHLTVSVNSAPAANTITGLAQVCSNQTAVNYQVTTPNATSTYSWSVSGGATNTGSLTPNNSSINVDFGTISPINIQVTETSSSGCIGSAASKSVTVNPRPAMTSSSTTSLCSSTTPTLVFTSSIASTYSWIIPAGGITGSITGAVVGQTGNGDLSATFTGGAALKNTSGAVGSVTFNVTPTSSATGCVGALQSVVVTVNPEPDLVNAQTKTICSGDAVNYEILTTPLNLPSGTSFTWPVPIMSDGSIQGSSGNVAAGVAGTPHILDVLSNLTSAPITAKYTITPTSGAGCAGIPKDVIITINPEPIMSSGLNATLCSDAPIGLTLATAAGSVAANNYNIIARNISAGLTASASNAVVPASGVASNYLANDSYTNVTNGPLTLTYSVVPVSASGCDGASKDITITINPEPSLSLALDATVCSDSPAGITLNTTGTSVAAGGYNIVGKTVAAGLVAGGGNAIVPALNVAANYISGDTYTNTTSGSLTVVYQVVPVSALGCPGDPPKSVTLTVLPEPVVSSSLNTSKCSGIATSLTLATTGTSVAAASYDITARTIDPGLVAGGSNVAVPASNVAASYLSGDVFTNTTNGALFVTYTVVPKSASLCLGDPKIITITINPEPVVSNALDATVCSDLPIGLTLNTNGSSVGASSYNITARSIPGGLTPNVANAAVPAAGVAANYLASDIFTNTGAVPLMVSYTVVPVSSAGCLGVSKTINITINPEPVVSGTLNASVCSSVPIGVTLNTNGTSVAAATYNITAISVAAGLTPGGGNAVVPNSGVLAGYISNDVFVNAGGVPLNVTYTIVPVSAAGCLGDSKVITMTVNPEPIMSNGLNATVCSNSTVGLTLNTNGTSVGAANYDITSVSVAVGLTSAGTNAIIPASNVASNYLANDKYENKTASSLNVAYTVVPISAAGCPGPSKTITMIINPEPVVLATLNASKCSDVATGLTLGTDASSVGAANYNITSRTIAAGLVPAGGNATVPAAGVVANYLAADIFTNTSTVSLNVTYTVVPVSAAGCMGAPQVITISIDPEPVVLSTLDNTICSGIATSLNLGTVGTSVAAASYNITAISIGAGLSAVGTNAVVPFSGAASNYLASDKFTNTTSASHIVTYTVVPVSAAGCMGDSKTITITVDPEPVVSTLLNSTVCSDAVINLTLNTNGTSVGAFNYNVTGKSVQAGLIGAGSNAIVPATGVAANYLMNDAYNNVGAVPLKVSYTVVPVSAGGCLGVPQVIDITINPEPVLSNLLNLSQCSDVATGLILNTNGVSVAAQNYNITLFSLAAGLTAAGGNATLPATGVNANYLGNDKFTNQTGGNLNVVYRVIPVSASGCAGNFVDVTVTIQPEPVVANGLDKTVCSDLPINLTLNTNGSSVAAATYNITSRAVAAGLIASGTNVAVPASGVAANYLISDSFTNSTNGSLTVTYTIVPVSGAGCLGDSKTVIVTIDPEPVIANGLDATVCSDNSIALMLNTNGVSIAAANYTIVSRTVAGGLVSAGSNAVVPASGVAANYLAGDKFTNTTGGPLNVDYVVKGTSIAGCEGDTKTIAITINAEPVIASGLDDTKCSDVPIALNLATNGTSIAAVSYNIVSRTLAAGLSGSGANAAVPASGVAANYLANDSFINNTSGALSVSYSVVPVSADGCLGDAKSIVMTINPEPVLSPSLNDTKCSGVSTALMLATNGSSVAAASYNITGINVAAGLVADGANAVIANGVAANYLANDKFINTGALPLAVVYTIVPVSAVGCLGDPQTVTITINPEPVVSTLLNATVCSSNSIGLTLATNGTSVAAANYNIISSTIAPGLTASIANAVVPFSGVSANYLTSDKFTNTGNSQLTVVYTVVPVSALGCVGAQQIITITVDPEPVLSAGLNKTACSDIAGGILLNTNGTSVAAANYNVTSVSIAPGLVTVGAAAIPASGVGANYLINDTYRNTGNVALVVSYTVVPVSAAGCFGVPLIIKQTVNPEPVLGSLDKSVCSDETLNLTLNTNGTSINAATYNVTAVSIAGGLVASGANAAIPATGVASSYIFNDKYTNTTNSDLMVMYTVVPVSGIGCVGDPVIVNVTIKPEPVVSGALDKTVCSGIVGGIVLNTNGTSIAAGSYNVTSIVADGGLTPMAGNAVVANNVGVNYLANDKFSNTTNSSLTVKYTIVPVSAAGCLGDPLDVVLTVDPQPVMDPGLALKTLCSRAVTGILLATNGSSVGAASYDVTMVSQDVGLTGVPTTGSGLAASAIQNDSYINVGSVPLKITYQIVPKSAAGCYGAAFNIVVTVNPEPVISPSLDNTVCSDDVSNIILGTNGTSAGASSYELVSVSVPGGVTANVSNAMTGSTGGINLIKGDKYTNNSNAVAVVVYGIRGTSNAGCVGQIQLINLTVNPEPVLDPALNPTPVCSGVISSVTLGVAPGSVAAASYNINSITFAGLTAGASNSGIGTGKASSAIFNDTYVNITNSPLSVVYKIVPVSAAGCLGDEETVTLTINPSPAIQTNLGKTTCSNDVSNVVFATQASSVAAVSYNIISVTIQAGLTQTAGNAGTRSVVAAGEVQNDKFQNLTNAPLNVTYKVEPVSAAGCKGPQVDIVLIVEPTVTMIVPPNVSTCSDSPNSPNSWGILLDSNTTPTSGSISFDYSATSTPLGAVSGFVLSQSNLPKGTTIAEKLVNNSDNVATVTYTIYPKAPGAKIGAGCSAAAPTIVTVTVEPKPKLSVSPSTQTVCEGSASSMKLSSTTVPGVGTLQFVKLSAVATGGMTLTSAPKSIYLNGESIADVWDNPTLVPQTVTYAFRSQVVGGLGCQSEDVSVILTVNPRPVITASAQPDICSGDFINITLTPDVANSIATWTVAKPATITGASNGAGNLIFQTLFNSGSAQETVTYTISPKVNGCDGTPLVIDVKVNPKPKITGLVTPVVVCHGGTLSVNLNGTVAGTQYTWTVDNPSGLPGITDQVAPGLGVINQLMDNSTGSQATLTYTITPFGPSGCPGDQKIMIVNVAPKIDAQFINSSSSICKGSSEFLIIQIDGQAPFQLVYNDGTSDITVNNAGNFKVIQVTPNATTTYTLKSVKDALNCSVTIPAQTVTISVGETDANFTIVGPTASCGPYNATFQFNQAAGTQYTWQWFDGSADDVSLAATTVANQTITHTFNNSNPNAPITYKVTLRTELPAPFPGCFKSSTKNITVNPSIITNAFPDRSVICSDESIQFYNQSFGATTNRWFYRVQGTTTELEVRTTPTVNYTFTNTSNSNPLVYEVVYQANNGSCPAADVVIPITVYRSIVAGFNEGTIPPYISGNSTVTFTNTSVPVVPSQFRYEWTFGLNAAPATQNGAGPFSVNYSTPGPKEVYLRVTNIDAETAGLSCTSELTKTINIPLLPLVAAFQASPVRACFPTKITITENTSTGDVMEWKLIDNDGRVAGTSTGLLPEFAISAPGKYSVFLTTRSSITGQVANTQKSDFEVFDKPLASFQLRPTVVFIPDQSITTFNFSTGATDYDWDFGDGGISADFEPTYAYKVEGVYDVTLKANNDHGGGVICSDTIVQKVTARQGGTTKVPNAFTPSNNGPSGGAPGNGGLGQLNDVFLPLVKGVEEFNMQIFDRWGNLIFESNSAQVGWDGYDKHGKLLPSGVYVYKLTFRLSDGQRTTQVGDITMIR